MNLINYNVCNACLWLIHLMLSVVVFFFVHQLFTAFTALSRIASEICLSLVWYYLNIQLVWHQSRQRALIDWLKCIGCVFFWLNDSILNFDVTIPLLLSATERKTCAYLNAFLLLFIKEIIGFSVSYSRFFFASSLSALFYYCDCHRLSVIWTTKNYSINFNVIRFPCQMTFLYQRKKREKQIQQTKTALVSFKFRFAIAFDEYQNILSYVIRLLLLFDDRPLV